MFTKVVDCGIFFQHVPCMHACQNYKSRPDPFMGQTRQSNLAVVFHV